VPKPDAPPLTRGVVLRGIGFGLAIALGALGVWLIVTSTTQAKRIELGVLIGLWGLLLGAFSLFGSRRTGRGDEGGLTSAPTEPVGGAVELRSVTALERADEAAARRAYEARLEHMLRREIQSTMTREVSSLHAEIAELRSELLEKVGGQLRLERIETTRLIGSDLEALQHQLRQLTVAARDSIDVVSGDPEPRARAADPLRPVVEPARVRPVSRQTAEVESMPQPAREPRPGGRSELAGEPPAEAAAQTDTEAGPTAASAAGRPSQRAAEAAGRPEPPLPPLLGPQPASRPAAPPARPAAAPSPPTPPAPPAGTAAAMPQPPVANGAAERPAQPVTPAAAPSAAPPPASPPSQPPPAAPPARSGPSALDFPALPRLSPFTDFGPEPEDEPQDVDYTGRRRREPPPPPPPSPAGRHSGGDEEEPTGRRHRRATDSDEPDDLLARLLAREGVR
jgi:hypothetical protein